MGFEGAFGFQWVSTGPSTFIGCWPLTFCIHTYTYIYTFLFPLRFLGGGMFLPTLGGGGLPRALQPERGGYQEQRRVL